MTDKSPITIDALLKRINRKLAPYGRIHKSSPREYDNRVGIWHVTENNTVTKTFDDITDFHRYAVDLGVTHESTKLTFPDGYFSKGSRFEGVTLSVLYDNDTDDRGLNAIINQIANADTSMAIARDDLHDYFTAALRKTMPELSKVLFEYDAEADECCVVEGTAPAELVKYINIANGVAQVHLHRLADDLPDDFETQFQEIVEQAANAIRTRYGEAAA